MVILWLRVALLRGLVPLTPPTKVRGIAGHIEQVERGAIRKSPQAHKHFCPLLPTAMVFVSYGFVLVQVQVHGLGGRGAAGAGDFLFNSDWGPVACT